MAAKAIKWDSGLRREYEELWRTCVVRDRIAAEKWVKRVASHRVKYEAVTAGVSPDLPWWVVGLVHMMESSLAFDKHLHNGDSLAGRTVRVPKGRPMVGEPPYTWEESAVDALTLKKLGKLDDSPEAGSRATPDYSLPRLLFVLEGYNGYGYRMWHPEVNSPYLWSGTNHYVKGKYVADGRFDASFVSKQVGIACVMKVGIELGIFR